MSDNEDEERTNFLDMEVDEFMSPSMRKIKDGVVFDQIQGIFDTPGQSMRSTFTAFNRMIKTQQSMLEQQAATIAQQAETMKALQASVEKAVAFEERCQAKMKSLSENVMDMRLLVETMENRTHALEESSRESNNRTGNLEAGIDQLVNNLNTMDEHMRILEFNLSGTEAAASGRQKVDLQIGTAPTNNASLHEKDGRLESANSSAVQREASSSSSSRSSSSKSSKSSSSSSSNGAKLAVSVPGTSKWADDFPHHALFLGQLPKELAATKGLSANLRTALQAVLTEVGDDAAGAAILESTSLGSGGVEIVDPGAEVPKNYAIVSFAERAHVAASLFVFEGKTLSVEFGPKTLQVGPLNVVRDFKPDVAAATAVLVTGLPTTASEDAKVDDSTTSGVLARDTEALVRKHVGATLAASGGIDGGPLGILTRFSRDPSGAGIAYVTCGSSDSAHAVVTALDGLVLGDDIVGARWLTMAQSKTFEQHVDDFRQKASVSAEAVRNILITNLSPKLTKDDFQWVRTLSEPYPLEKFEVLRDPTGGSFGMALATYSSEVHPDEVVGLQNSMRQHNTNSGQKVVCISLASMKTLTLKSMTAERRAVIVKSLRAYLRQVMMANKFRGIMSQKISDPKNNMMQRIQDAEHEAAKVKKLSKRAEKAEARESELRAQLRALRDIEADPEFSRRFDERVGHGTQKATEAAVKEVSGKLKEEVCATGLFEMAPAAAAATAPALDTVEDEGDGNDNEALALPLPPTLVVKDEYIAKLMEPAVDALKESIVSAEARFEDVEKRFDGVHDALAQKLDTPGLGGLVESMKSGEIDGPNSNPLARLKKLIDGDAEEEVKAKLKALEAQLSEQMKSMSESERKRVSAKMNKLSDTLSKTSNTQAEMDTMLVDVDSQIKTISETVDTLSKQPNWAEEIARVAEKSTTKIKTQEKELQKVMLAMDERPTNEQVQNVVDHFERLVEESTRDLKKKPEEAQDAATVLEHVKKQLQIRTTRQDVARMVAGGLSELGTTLRYEFMDQEQDNMWTLRSGSLPDSFTFGKVKYRAVREGLPLGPTQRAAAPGMPRVGAAHTGGQHPMYRVARDPGPIPYKLQRDRPPLQSHYENPQLLAVHDSWKSPSKRGGALQPLGKHTQPMIALENPVEANSQNFRPHPRGFQSKRSSPSKRSNQVAGGSAQHHQEGRRRANSTESYGPVTVQQGAAGASDNAAGRQHAMSVDGGPGPKEKYGPAEVATWAMKPGAGC